ncbi:DUF3124 domain-containing protein [uncultured Roseibium sp.]|uniref:DUF3124 domain-containing protein n=1 Tax=uncultured Roseibium sp. TaxID=1936171 RepID=UPI002621EA5F|nr:DUF3124 domain-containing protein [uncultured Roseibium sp.]
MIKILMSLVVVVGAVLLTPANAQEVAARVLGEIVYVPAYSRIFSHPDRSDLLAATLAVHNIDPDTPITLQSVEYHGEDGTLLRELLDNPLDLGPLQSGTVLVPINDTTGGVGANFLLEWTSATPALSPIAEAIMTSGSGGPGPSFTSRGRVIEQRIPAD